MADVNIGVSYGLCPSWALSVGYLGVASAAVLSNWGSAVRSSAPSSVVHRTLYDIFVPVVNIATLHSITVQSFAVHDLISLFFSIVSIDSSCHFRIDVL